ncbi:MAG: protease family protein [Verrucomicrobiota bacterium]
MKILNSRADDPSIQSTDTTQALPSDDPIAAALRGFGPVGILAILIILAGNFLVIPLSAILVLIWRQLSHTSWREIGYVRPRSWIVAVVVGIIFGIVFKFAMKAIVMPLLGAPPINQAYHFLAGNRAALAWMIFVFIVGAGFGEETVFRGWMFERLGKLFGTGATAKIAIVLVVSVLFGLAHYAVQGLYGVEQAIITGCVFGTIFAVTGSIFLPMIVHAVFDLTALALIYWDLETPVAHFIFK